MNKRELIERLHQLEYMDDRNLEGVYSSLETLIKDAEAEKLEIEKPKEEAE